jgi:ribose/xylose/arabinose/galactoside ABC-type transport system permease subunit
MESNLQKGSFVKQLYTNRLFGVILVAAAMFIFLTIASEYFFTPTNIINLLNQTALKSVLALGMTFVIIMGGIDLSVGAIVSISAMFAADVMLKTGGGVIGIFGAVAVAIAVGLSAGLLNGFFIAKFDLAPFLVTMGTMNIYRGIGYVYSNAATIRISSNIWLNAWHARIPLAVVILAIVVVVAILIIKFTKYGRYIFAIGGNETASKLSGINTLKTKIITYTFLGLICGICGLIYLGRMSSSEANAGMGYELDAIAAAAIGGASLAGGKGSIVGTLIGAFILSMLMNGLTLLSVQAYYQVIFTGVIILIAIIIDKYATK